MTTTDTTPTPSPEATPPARPFTISDSQVNSFLRCPKAWEYRYVKGLKIAPSWAITGRSAHAAEEANYKQKLDSFEDMKLKDVLEIASDEFDKTLKDPTDEIIWGEDESPAGAKDRTIMGVETYHRHIAPKVQPVLVEEKVELILPWGTPMTGRMDVVDQDTNIRDTKHVSYEPRQGEDWYGTQPGLYGWAYQQMTGEIPNFTYDYIVLGRKNAAKPRASWTTKPTTMTQERIDLALARIQGVEKLIKAGAAPANANQFNCAGCGYRVVCPYAAK